MVDGINQNVEVFGRTFHVQTEVTGGARRAIRSTVFLDGAIVASRSTDLGVGEPTDDQIEERIAAQHEQIIGNLLRRAADFDAAMAGSGAPDTRPRPARPAPPAIPQEAPRPELDDDPEVLRSVKVRTLLGPFSLGVRPSPYHDPESLRARVDGAADMIEALMSSPDFADVRLDEQVRFFDLKERIAAWRNGGRDAEEAGNMLLAMVVFAGHLRRISDRRELVAFDHRLLTWALAAVGRDGLGDELLDHLEPLAGRDAELDEMLARRDTVTANRLIEVLLGLLDRTLV